VDIKVVADGQAQLVLGRRQRKPQPPHVARQLLLGNQPDGHLLVGVQCRGAAGGGARALLPQRCGIAGGGSRGVSRDKLANVKLLEVVPRKVRVDGGKVFGAVTACVRGDGCAAAWVAVKKGCAVVDLVLDDDPRVGGAGVLRDLGHGDAANASGSGRGLGTGAGRGDPAFAREHSGALPHPQDRPRIASNDGRTRIRPQ